MTISSYDSFETEFFVKLRKESKKCLKIIDENQKLIEFNLCEKDLYQVRKFVSTFNDIVLDKGIEKYKLFNEVLKHPLLSTVLAQFRESDVLVRACKNGNVNAVKWLLTMNINYGVQDEFGATALMYAAKCSILDFAIKEIMDTNGKHIHLVDKEGNSVIFYAAENYITFSEIIKYKDKFDFNALNNRNENLILYCSRNRKISSARAIDFLNLLYKYNNNGINFENDNGKTAAMYLAEGFRYRELYYFVKKFKVDPNFKSKLGNTLTSVFIKKYYQIYMNRIIEKEGFCLNNQLFKKAIATLDCLCNIGCDVNVPIDEDGTTMLMICSKLHDD
ncbi:hypothetical protein PIROE2DRAFT_5751, partial [Piromyces sp. E2]